ncbi:response regulator transcription factor [Bacillus solitudinis]|uniref:response regulator transcription factor n=1 Tax=Bacillus solitudinis TaxID=2014074 RepID=UPI000C249B6D|nr:response regulator [Bacillus solitudinis]
MNIFLVEDERWALAELRELFKRYEPTHHVYAYENGDDALAATETIHPHLVVSDITMPGMNGLELIKNLRQKDKYINCMILSVHDQFDYARQGLKLGIVDYLLKPIKKDDLYETVDKAIASIEIETIEKQAREQWSINQMLLTPSMSEEDSSSIQKLDYFVVCLLAENWNSKSAWKGSSFSNDELKKYVSQEIVPLEEVYCVDLDAQRKLILMPLSNVMDYHMAEANVQCLYRILKNEMTIHVCYARKKINENIKEVYMFLTKQLETHMLFGHSSFIKPDTLLEIDEDLTEAWMKIRIIESHIQKGEILKVREVIETLATIIDEQEITQRQLKLFVTNMYYALAFKLQQQKGTGGDLEINMENIDKIDELVRFSDLTEWLIEIVTDLAKSYTPQVVAPKQLIPRVIDWVHQQYQENLFFQDFANEYYVSLSYLSREFKAQTGDTFSDYLMRYRIDKAKEFFDQGIEKTGQVGQMVGYEDTKHFSSVFKRITGVTPTEYKKLRG